MEQPSTETINRALRVLENQRKASQAYYARHIDAVKSRNANYWIAHREAINARRRMRYHMWREANLAPQIPAPQ